MIEMYGDGLRVTGPMLIANASALLEAGRGFLRGGVVVANPAPNAVQNAAATPLVFDLSAVEETDSSALSVVFGWLRTARERGVPLRIVYPPASMISQAALYGVSDSLPLA